jgi:RimJ/RimL family protein N-acetyltransferase
VATRALAAWARLLFDQGLDHLALHVNGRNRPAIGAYERVGFRPHAMLRLILAY